MLQDFRDNVDPTAQLSERKWRPVRAMYRALVRNAFDGIWFPTVSRAGVGGTAGATARKLVDGKNASWCVIAVIALRWPRALRCGAPPRQ
ncbi:hypothetical protein, partial [Mycobacterium riyadhense]